MVQLQSSKSDSAGPDGQKPFVGEFVKGLGACSAVGGAAGCHVYQVPWSDFPPRPFKSYIPPG